jgi:hypothetical protein
MTFLTQKVKVVAMATNHQNVRTILNWHDDSYNKHPYNVFFWYRFR